MGAYCKHGPGPELRACHNVAPADELGVVKKLLSSASGSIVSGGLFAVPHKTDSDRIINDGRPFKYR